ncbi:tRNA threonylcarbamoyl adenosine modification protein YeaZ [Microbacterium terrae]|uniref:tRNA threonylcarbamoyladenosine biosynthesis protein TsaB n=1 Tax=Microbacterium terrae TaxID=69369 RepID=A0A0M2HAA7_9MICO|nr:tRNA (adenosine(37)-N6)-threonylcarbamoyltransferase complex dimerization subunit type 1 TsaB [Microbacterium terrae]KJL40960.1 tRNA threonylcarbamoyladenosine biosynthesis protein TsaB [Microbacterium terrae]MBP1078249.1 tRNA threonylcarbamoyl adenosine modification protein YeaZ [Microbacterium terrae]GLJ97729.1 tRNA (adenosine(37)-N6)-threonylcarbamoyltransferase complex dimerization subunit type 1 TsaB [Microbacterium terrae]
MILGIDTSLGTAVAVVEPDGAVRSQLESADPRGHAEVIGTLIERALAEASVRPAGITAVAAGMGPGPFTGLRVGIAAARTFALGRGVEVIPVVSHDAVALELLLHDALTGGYDDEQPEAFAVVTDARRREFAYTVYRGLDDDGLPVRLAEPGLAPRDDLDGVLAARGILRRDADRISAAMLAVTAGRAVAAGRVIGPHDALYLRSPDVTMPGAPKKVGA